MRLRACVASATEQPFHPPYPLDPYNLSEQLARTGNQFSGASGAEGFCEIGVIRLIGVGSSSTVPAPAHIETKWSTTERRLSR